jgi:hypothetical protein
MESEPLLNRAGALFFCSVLCIISKYKGFGVYSMNKTGRPQTLCVTGRIQKVELAAAQHLLSVYSSPCLGVKFVYNYGLGERTAR